MKKISSGDKTWVPREVWLVNPGRYWSFPSISDLKNDHQVGEDHYLRKQFNDRARLQQYVNCELPDVQARFRKGRGTRDQIANIRWIIGKAREFPKTIYFCFIDYAKAYDCVDYNKLWKILQEMGIPGHLTCLFRNLYVGQEATVRTGREQQTGSK